MTRGRCPPALPRVCTAKNPSIVDAASLIFDQAISGICESMEFLPFRELTELAFAIACAPLRIDYASIAPTETLIQNLPNYAITFDLPFDLLFPYSTSRGYYEYTLIKDLTIYQIAGCHLQYT